jgi:hypothetical protein
MRIVWWKEEYGGKPPANRDVNEAAKNIVMMDLAILSAEAAAMYRKADRGSRQGSPIRAVAARNANGGYRGVAAWEAIANAGN